MKKNIYKYSLFVFALLLSSCANIVAPSGGSKDVTPPVVQKTDPENFSKEFKSKSLKIDFDEYVKIVDATSQVVVSPYMKEPPVFKIKGKSIVMDFKDTLKPNTTYSVSFGKAIADNNEGNVLLNYCYVFSTGKIIDTLTLKGVVKNAFTLKPEKGIFVFLYDHIFDSVPYKETPLYLSKTNEDGSFAFVNVKNGKYKLFALKDGNSNFLFDPPGEMIAFSDSLVTPKPAEKVKVDTSKKNKTDSTKAGNLKKIKSDTTKLDTIKKNRSYNLSLFEEIPAKQKMLKAYAAKYGNVVLAFRKPLENLVISPLTKGLASSWDMQEMNDTKDSVTLWLKNPDMDSLVIKVTENNVILDTAEIALAKKGNNQKLRGKSDENKTVGIKACVSDNGSFDFYKNFSIKCFSPIAEFNSKKIILTENKDTVKAKYSFSDSIKRHVSIDYKWKEKTTYNLFIQPGTFTDIFNRLNDTLKIKFTTTSENDYGNIKIAIKNPESRSHYIVQLVAGLTDVVVQENFSELNEPIQFKNIAAGNYKIKLIYDNNNNKKWDTGNYLKKDQPEKIIYYPSAILVKSNWDLDLDWELSK